MNEVLKPGDNFLGIEEESLCSYKDSYFVIQQAPYEKTSSYISGSDKGPAAIIEASRYVELYDEELDGEPFRDCGIATLEPMSFENLANAQAIDFIESETSKIIEDEKFVVSFGAEHTVTLGFVKAHLKKYPDLCVLQLDAHSDLREQYKGNPYSHASVMARVHDLGVAITQIGIRAQCVEESQYMKSSNRIHTFYAHSIRKNDIWMQQAIDTLAPNVYLTIDADGFDPSIMPAVGTAEPGGLLWDETLEFLKLVASRKNIVGFDIVEVAPGEGNIISEYTLAKLAYKLIGYINRKNRL